eukprot:TRINITY_DN1374_c0_g1::TRINITY_DN1374_c0_g1_i1::g.20050::m.20050 TRINITY_DN1374_c0_g1::TRINITY_DN1374_c0_g1_i1::g.20050  ORF type:complete len:900 (-),score=322.79,sp/Q0WW26/COPG_ARATH/44.52/0.0,Adaptin_N/PF01602.15/3.3e-92,COP-gamma_platf/PF08752.5/2.6e-47,HEAT_2/PF13646.1/5.8,HEAT_2/PF13646.1/0.34,HEAT_2/PF13646.1/0.0012,Cnd1/PF12717.2/82,Cnd1/PF12717.2/11,Cnd1/PF12717.2/2.2e+03,Cnd1/PF12717.2/0.00057,HEAT/PF02985.17/1.5e+04,HEAT/PF02985.17/3.6e+03,HEAT/PF02985.17/53,HEAT/PF02985.17/0.083,HEAT_
MDDSKRKTKDEDEHYSPYTNLDKSSVLQQTRIFHDNNLNSTKCCQLLMKILYLICQGETFSSSEATDVFFGVTKLFQSNNQNLRRLVYLFIKEMTNSSEEVIIVTNCLTKDMVSRNTTYRANSVRVLSKIIDSAMLGQLERYLKQGIVDSNAAVASAALVSAICLYKKNPQIVSRWVNEVTQASTRSEEMIQYHAYALLYLIKQNDKLAVSRLVASSTKTPPSAYAHMLLIRYTAQVMDDEIANHGPEEGEKYGQFLLQSLRHHNDNIVLEAARVISLMSNPPQNYTHEVCICMVRVLSSFLPVKKFAAVRILNRIAMKNASQYLSIWMPTTSLEALISNTNRSIATLAITTLLKTGAESSIDKLMKQLTTFMPEIADEFKVVVVDALRSLCLKFPKRHRSILTFLSTVLRDEGGYEFKRSVVDAVLGIVEAVKEAEEPGLLALCEFIEDCEYFTLSAKILALLAAKGAKLPDSAKYLRFIYNRVVLENGMVRAAAVGALVRFAVEAPHLKESAVVILKRCIHDDNDEVRDRAVLALKQLERSDVQKVKTLLVDSLPYPVENMVESLEQYLQGSTKARFDIKAVSLMDKTPAKKATTEDTRKKTESAQAVSAAGSADAAAAAAAGSVAPGVSGGAPGPAMSAQLAAVADELHLGPKLTSSKRMQLTENETEYNVTCTKHAFLSHLVLQFDVVNTLEDQLLDNVFVKADLSDLEGLSEFRNVPIKSLPYSTPGQTFLVCAHEAGSYPTGTISTSLKFKVRDVDPTTGEADTQGYDDEYQLEEVEVKIADYIAQVSPPQFQAAWELLGGDHEVTEAFTLPHKTIKESAKALIEFLGLKPCDATDTVSDHAKEHQLILSGVLGKCQILARIKLTLTAKGIGMDTTIRSQDTAVSELIASSIA